MFIELVDALRCPRTHEESWLVLAASRLEYRHVRDGTLGCPVCHAEYPIRDGIVDLRLPDAPGESADPSTTLGMTATTVGMTASALGTTGATDRVSAEQLAALLDLGDALGFAVLVGAWTGLAERLLAGLDNPPPLVLVDPLAEVEMSPGLSGIRAGATLPLAAGAARAIAVDTVDDTRLADAARVTRAGGRMVAPGSARVPDGVRELVRNESLWVGEREAPPAPLVRLHVRRA